MSTRAIASQRNKRTLGPAANMSNPTIPKPTARTPTRPPSGNASPQTTRRELSVQEAFSLVNNKISNLEKAVFEGDFTRPKNTNMPPKMDEIQDIYTQINEIRDSLAAPPSNPYTSINTVTSFDTINSELLLMKNDMMSMRSSTQRIDQLNDDVSQIRESIKSVGNNASGDVSDKVAAIETYVGELKDIIIKLQNFTLEINDMCIKNIKSSSFDPYMMSAPDEDDFPDMSMDGIIIDHNNDHEIVIDDIGNSGVIGLKMSISEPVSEDDSMRVMTCDTLDFTTDNQQPNVGDMVEAEVETVAEVEVETVAEVEVDAMAEVEVEVDAEAEVEVDAMAEVDAKVVTETDEDN